MTYHREVVRAVPSFLLHCITADMDWCQSSSFQISQQWVTPVGGKGLQFVLQLVRNLHVGFVFLCMQQNTNLGQLQHLGHV